MKTGLVILTHLDQTEGRQFLSICLSPSQNTHLQGWGSIDWFLAPAQFKYGLKHRRQKMEEAGEKRTWNGGGRVWKENRKRGVKRVKASRKREKKGGLREEWMLVATEKKSVLLNTRVTHIAEADTKKWLQQWSFLWGVAVTGWLTGTYTSQSMKTDQYVTGPIDGCHSLCDTHTITRSCILPLHSLTWSHVEVDST